MVIAAQVPPAVRPAASWVTGVRLPDASERSFGLIAACAAERTDVILAPIAVEPLGRRAADAPTHDAALDAVCARRAGGAPIVAVLDHAGPAAALWSRERPVGPSEQQEPRTGRRPRALDPGGWTAVTDAYVHVAACCAARGVPCALGIDDDGLLHAALSPRTSGAADIEATRARIIDLHAAVSQAVREPLDVVLVVEELCPRGLDATDGLALVSSLRARGVRRVYAGAGTAALPALRARRKGGTARGAHHALHSAAWLVRSGVEVIALVPALDEEMHRRARALGLHGVVEDAALNAR